MAQARKIGREYAITNAVTEIIGIPSGVEHAGQTLINDGSNDIFWREYDPTITVAGTIAVLIATPIFASRLQAGEYVHIPGINIVAVCSTDEQETTSTLRVAPGRLYQSGDTDIAAMAADIGSIDDKVAVYALQERTRDLLSDMSDQTIASTGGTVAFGALPEAADTLTITDNRGAQVYTFVTPPTGAANEVDIAIANRDQTMINLVAAININAPDADDPSALQGVTATHVEVAGADNDTLTLAPRWPGADGNTTLATSTPDIAVVSLSGGTDATNQLGTIDADTGAIKTAIELIDHLTAANSGNKDGNTQRVVNATDDIPLALVNTKLDTITEALGGADTFTYTHTAINIAAADTIDLGGNVAAQYAYLVDLVLTMDVQGTITLRDSSDGDGAGTPVPNTGDMLFGAGGGINLHVDKNAIADRAQKSSVVNRHLELVATQGCNGYAVVASGA